VPDGDNAAPPRDAGRPHDGAGAGATSTPLPRGALDPWRFLLVVAQLGLLALVIRQFQVESGAFMRIALLAFAGFVVHAVLPLRFRQPMFVVLSLVGIALVFGFREGAWLIGVGLVLIGACHLPGPLWVRAGLLIAIGVLLAVHRLDWLPAPWSPAVWPILGSMFMFRLIVYVYDLRHEKERPSPWRSLAYFFLLPNVCFPLFPVVDYKTFRRNYYDDDACRIYQVGVDWMARGIVQLIAYRFVYYYLTLGPSEVTGAGSLARFVVANFLLYLRVSGQFHLVIGMLHLFGFRLPETHRRYLLASSFTDFWRRINIYWKDFMQKIFYYPLYFWLRRWGATRALVLATVSVFVMTWLLHAYQWFWLRGTVLLTGPDMLFWAILAALVVVNSLYEMKHGRERTLGAPTWTVRSAASVAARTIGTFATICLLWSLWTAESVTAWIALWTSVVESPRAGASLLSVAVLAAAVAGRRPTERPLPLPWTTLAIPRSALRTIGSLVILAAAGLPVIYTSLGPDLATLINSLRSGRLSRLDTALLERGYYEDLLRVDRFNSQLWEVYTKRPPNPWLDVQGAGLERFTGDFRQKELIPSFASATRHGVIRTNRWGMRDQDYDRRPAPGTYRMAVLGASTVMGWGVNDGETFEAQLEERLNRELAGGPYRKFELLNFSVPGYQPPQQLMVLDRVLTFAPDAILYVATGREITRAAQYLAEVTRKGIPIPYDPLRIAVERARIDAETDESTALRRLGPFQGDILSWIYEYIAGGARQRGIVPVFVFLPQVEEGAWREETPDILRRASAAGFVVVNLDDVYRDRDIRAIRLAEWDNHPNADGHRLIAARLYEELRARDCLIFGAGRASAASGPEDLPHGEDCS
jgi:D-alanyl-lipoteichoic acid acyltransferase DltB (MBOAT superfamily)